MPCPRGAQQTAPLRDQGDAGRFRLIPERHTKGKGFSKDRKGFAPQETDKTYAQCGRRELTLVREVGVKDP